MSLYSQIRTNGAKNSRKFKNILPQPKFTFCTSQASFLLLLRRRTAYDRTNMVFLSGGFHEIQTEHVVSPAVALLLEIMTSVGGSGLTEKHRVLESSDQRDK